jgi:general secretion pathway protein G
MKRSLKRSAFSLIELLLVLVILGVLAAIVVPKFTSKGEQARITAAGNSIAQMGTALEMFEVENGRYPSNEEGLQALITAPSSMQQTWNGPYLKNMMTVPNDPWNRPYVYRFPSNHSEKDYDLSSLGPDGTESGDDISNWNLKK